MCSGTHLRVPLIDTLQYWYKAAGKSVHDYLYQFIEYALTNFEECGTLDLNLVPNSDKLSSFDEFKKSIT